MKIFCIQLGDSTERNNLAQVINDLTDSEAKLVNTLSNIDDYEKSEEVIVIICFCNLFYKAACCGLF